MCFETTKSARAKIAKIDIECWKTLINGSRCSFTCCHGIEHNYEKGIVQPIIKLIKESDSPPLDHVIINKGYHSYKSLDVAKYEMNDILNDPDDPDDEDYYQFIIPAGTRYYENEYEYVSETIMML